MLRLSPFWFCTNSVPVNSLEVALDVAAEFGFKYVEIAAIENSTEHICAEKVDNEYVALIEKMLSARGLTCIAVSAHCDMTDDRQFERFLKKLEFAGKIKAKYINTRCGPLSRYPQFVCNLDIALKIAEKYNVQINLESYGDIIGDAKSSFSVFEKLARNVGYNYDPGNLYRFAKGDISFVDDLKSNLKYMKSMHIKDAILENGYIVHTPIGNGNAKFGEIFEQLENVFTELPAGLEVPLSFRVRTSDFVSERLSPSLEEAKECIKASLDYIQSNCIVKLKA